MAHDVVDVANFVVHQSLKRNKLINNLHLQNTLYFLQAYYLVKLDQKLFEEDIEMWRLGPVVPKVYDEYKMYGSSNILEVIKIPVFNHETLLVDYKGVDDSWLIEEERMRLERLINVILERDPFYLLDKVLEHDLWKDHKEEVLSYKNVRGKRTYNINEMKKFFKEEENRRELLYEIF